MKQVFITAVKPPLGVSVSQLGVSGFETLFYIPGSHLAVTVPWEMNQQMEYLLTSQIKKKCSFESFKHSNRYTERKI